MELKPLCDSVSGPLSYAALLKGRWCLLQSLKAELARQQDAAQKAEAKSAASEQALRAEQSREGSTHALQQVRLLSCQNTLGHLLRFLQLSTRTPLAGIL